VLDEGHVIEQGTHDELLAKKSAYFEIYQKQQLQAQQESL
jgi:ATP-binding cassette subfamily B protein